MPRRVAMGSDHAGRALRLHLISALQACGHTIIDVGCDSEAAVDYPKYAIAVTDAIAHGDAELGIAICGTGLGMSMAANRIAGMRAALCTDSYLAELARTHNDANILCLGERVVGRGLALAIANAFLSAEFAQGRHTSRVAQLTALENRR